MVNEFNTCLQCRQVLIQDLIVCMAKQGIKKERAEALSFILPNQLKGDYGKSKSSNNPLVISPLLILSSVNNCITASKLGVACNLQTSLLLKVIT